ncbi:protein TTE1956 [Biomphalaria glabrata]
MTAIFFQLKNSHSPTFLNYLAHTKLECCAKHGYAIFDDTNMWLWVPSTLRLHEETIKATKQSIVHITRSSKQKKSIIVTFFFTYVIDKNDLCMHYRCCSFDEEACSRRWGEVIPLHFIPNITNMKTVILSYPSCRYSKAVEMIPELLALGSSLYSILEK